MGPTGFGHRVYRVRDPRADVLKRVVVALRGESNRIRFAEEVEATAIRLLARRKQGRGLDTNVEFDTALLLEALALPRDLFTAVFAVGRARRLGGPRPGAGGEPAGSSARNPEYVGPIPRRAA